MRHVMLFTLILLAGCDLFGGVDPNDIEYRVRGNAKITGIVIVDLASGDRTSIGYINGRDPGSYDRTEDVDGGAVVWFSYFAECGSEPICETSAEIRAGGKTIARSELGREIDDPQAFGVAYTLGAVSRLEQDEAAVRFEIDPDAGMGVSYTIGSESDDLRRVTAPLDARKGYAAGDTASMYLEMGSLDGGIRCASASVSIAISDSAWVPVAGGRFCSERSFARVRLRAAIPE